MPRVIDNRSQLDQTVRIFDSFYEFDLKVNAAEYDIVYGYFTSVCATKNIAANFTVFLFRVAQETGIDVQTLLQNLQGSGNALQMNQQMAYFLNSLKSKTSLYGVGNTPQPNQPVARNIVQ